MEDDHSTNRLEYSENFPKVQKYPSAVAILDMVNRWLGKIKENKGKEGYADLVNFF